MLRSVRTSANLVLALEPTILEMRESVTGDPSGIFRPVSTAWHTTKIFLREYHDCPVEINRDVGQLPANLCDRNNGVATSSVESRGGIRVLLSRDFYLTGHGTAGPEESVVSFSGELQRSDVGDQGRRFCDVNAGRFIISQSLSLSFLNAPRDEFVFVESTR